MPQRARFDACLLVERVRSGQHPDAGGEGARLDSTVRRKEPQWMGFRRHACPRARRSEARHRTCSERRSPGGWLESAGLLYSVGTRAGVFGRFTLGGGGWLAVALRGAGRLFDIYEGLPGFYIGRGFQNG